MLYALQSLLISEFIFSLPKSVTSTVGLPKNGITFSKSMSETAVDVLSLMGDIITYPVAASTVVHIPTCPAAERGMFSKSICILSPNLRAVCESGCNGTFTFGLLGFALAQISQDRV